MGTKTKNKVRVAQNVSTTTRKITKGSSTKQPKSVILAKGEIRTTREYGQLMAALVSDVIQENISPTLVNAAVNAGRQMIKVAELNLKYGRKVVNNDKPEKDACLNLLTGRTE